MVLTSFSKCSRVSPLGRVTRCEGRYHSSPSNNKHIKLHVGVTATKTTESYRQRKKREADPLQTAKEKGKEKQKEKASEQQAAESARATISKEHTKKHNERTTVLATNYTQECPHDESLFSHKALSGDAAGSGGFLDFFGL